jgi:hypothetical protein
LRSSEFTALLDEVGLAFFDQQDAALAQAKALELVVDQRIGDVEDVQRHLRLAKGIGQAQHLERAQHAVVKAALHDDAEVFRTLGKELVELALLDELDGGGPAVSDLLLLLRIAGRRQHHAAGVALRVFDRVFEREAGALVGLGEAAVHVAGAYAQLQHHRCAAGFREFEAQLHRTHDAFKIGPRVDQPDLRLHREGVRALLHDAGAFAVVFTHDQHGTAGDAARGEVGQRVGRHVGADRGLEGDGAAQRVVDGSGQRGGGGGFRRAVFKVHAELGQDVVGVGQHVHQVRDGCALVAGHVRDAGLQQRLGHGQDAFAAKLVALAQAQLFNFLREGTLSHGAGLERRIAVWVSSCCLSCGP